MKTTFTKEYLRTVTNSFEQNTVDGISFGENEEVTLQVLFDYMNIEDFIRLLCRKSDLTTTQLQTFAVKNASHVLPLYEKQYPNDKTMRECIECTKLYLNKEATIQELKGKRDNCRSTWAVTNNVSNIAYNATRTASTAANTDTSAAAHYAATIIDSTIAHCAVLVASIVFGTANVALNKAIGIKHLDSIVFGVAFDAVFATSSNDIPDFDTVDYRYHTCYHSVDNVEAYDLATATLSAATNVTAFDYREMVRKFVFETLQYS